MFIFIDSLAKAKKCAKKLFIDIIGCKPADTLRFVDMETLENEDFGAKEKFSKEEATMVLNLQRLCKDSGVKITTIRTEEPLSGVSRASGASGASGVSRAPRSPAKK